MIIVGDVAFGLVTTDSGFDYPFAWNLATRTLLSVGGVTPANQPASPPTSGAWTPPIMDVLGPKILVAHPGFNGASVARLRVRLFAVPFRRQS
jgi:hypothetical protein